MASLPVAASFSLAPTPLRTELGGVNLTLTTTFIGEQACGFMNQHTKLLVLLTVAIYMRVDTVLVPASVHRDAFGTQHGTQWQAASASSLWNLHSIANLLQRFGLSMLVNDQNVVPPGAITLPSIVQRNLPVHFIDRTVRDVLRAEYAKIQGSQGVRPSTATVLWLPDLMLGLRTWDLPLYAEVAKSVRWAPALYATARAFHARMLASGSGQQFNGLHLRVEADLLKPLDLVEHHLKMYKAAIVAVKFDRLPLFVASGALNKRGSERYTMVEKWLQEEIIGEGHASSWFTHNTLLEANSTGAAGLPVIDANSPLHEQSLGKLNWEQRAAVDFLIIARSAKVVGTWFSSFSFALREFRALRNISRNSTQLIIHDVVNFISSMAFAYGPDVTRGY